jgi:hypothetical protein
LEKSTSYEAPHYAVISNLLSLHLSYHVVKKDELGGTCRMNVLHISRESENLEASFKCNYNVKINFTVEGCSGSG